MHSSAWGNKKRLSDSLQSELQLVMKYHMLLEAKPRSSTRGSNALRSWAVSPVARIHLTISHEINFKNTCNNKISFNLVYHLYFHFILCIWVYSCMYFVCIYTCVPQALCPWRLEEGVGSPASGVSMWMKESNLSTLKGQQVLIYTGSSLQALNF